MDRNQRILVIVLVAQLALLLVLQNPFGHSGAGGGKPLFPKLASTTPGKIEITGADSATVTLERDSGTWVLADPKGFPTAAGKVQKLLDDVEHLTTARPVASDTSSHAALKVAGDRFERRVRIWGGAGSAPAAELFVGSSSGAGATHVRAGGSPRVFEEDVLSSYDIPTDAASWVERKLVPFEATDVEQVALENPEGRFALAKQDGRWRVVEPASLAHAALDSTKVQTFVRALCGLTLDRPVGAVDAAAQGLSHPQATIELQRSAAAADSASHAPTTVTVRIGATVAGHPDDRYAIRTGLDFAVSVPGYSTTRAMSAKLGELFGH